MDRKQLIPRFNLILFLMLALTSAASGCFPIISSNKSRHLTEATLIWYAYINENDAKENRLKEEYQKRIKRYLELFPQTSKEIADKMLDCRVILGMTEEQVSLMVKPHYVLKGRRRGEKVFKYSNVGKFEWSKYIGEGVKLWVTFKDGVVIDINEVSLTMGY